MTLPRRLLPSLSALQSLDALRRLGSVTAAAREMSLSQSAVSRQLQGLEDQLGVSLFRRVGRQLYLTEAAERYAAATHDALQLIEKATMELAIRPTGGHLSLAILPSFGMRWLVPRLSDFARQHPDITINLTTRTQDFSFSYEPFDMAIFFGSGGWHGCRALRLMPDTLVALCSPVLFPGKPTPGDFIEQPLLHIQTRPKAWTKWFAAHELVPPATPGMMHDQYSTILQAAAHGLGVALVPDFMAEQELASGRLIQCGLPLSSDGFYQLVWPIEKEQDRALVIFRDWIAAYARDEDTLPR